MHRFTRILSQAYTTFNLLIRLSGLFRRCFRALGNVQYAIGALLHRCPYDIDPVGLGITPALYLCGAFRNTAYAPLKLMSSLFNLC